MTRPVFAAAVLMWSFSAAANNTGGVFGPTVNEGHRSAQFRTAYDDDHRLANRLHYQSALDDDFMWRIVGQLRKSNDRTTDFDYLQGELFWQLPDAGEGWRQGLRFDLRYRNDDRPHQLGLNWMHEWDIAADWSTRFLLLTTAQFGDNDRAGLGLQARGSVTRRLPQRQSLSMSWFSDYGTTADTRSGSEQVHQLGPTYEFNATARWRVLIGALYGVTDATPDYTYRVWLTYGP